MLTYADVCWLLADDKGGGVSGNSLLHPLQNPEDDGRVSRVSVFSERVSVAQATGSAASRYECLLTYAGVC